MCFSEKMSLTIGLTGLIAASFLVLQKKAYAAAIGISYFALMEMIQYFQYKVINQCANPWNKFLTQLGYAHICFQPLFFNIWLLAFVSAQQRHLQYKFIIAAFIAGLLLLTRVFRVKDNEMCDGHHEPLCGKRTCAFSGEKHIAWNVRLRAPGKHWATPSIGLHFFFWIVPVLVLFELKPILAVLLTGPYFGMFLTSNIHEQPAIWCYTAIAQMLFTFFALAYTF